MNKNALYVRLQAKPEKAVELETFIKDKLSLVQKEDEVNSWYAIKLSPSSYGIFASFDNEVSLKLHLAGNFMDELTSVAAHMLMQKPEIIQADLLASKIGAETEYVGAAAAVPKKYDLRFIDGL